MEEFLRVFGPVSLGAVLGFTVEKLIEIWRLKTERGRERFKIKAEVYADWITNANKFVDGALGLEYEDKTAETLESIAEAARVNRNGLKNVSDRLSLFVKYQDRKKLESRTTKFFALAREYLVLLRRLASAAEKEQPKKLVSVLRELIQVAQSLDQQNQQIKKLLYEDISV